MKLLQSARCFLLVASALALSACGGNGAGPTGATPAQPGGASGVLGTQDLLYVSDSQGGSVEVYSYPEGKLENRLLNLKASALCSDTSGNVYVPQGNGVLEYAHGGTRPIARLDNPLGGVTQFCAVDATTGNLAVSGGTARNYGVAIYANARGNPRIYAAGGNVYRSLSYDNQGNLFIATIAGGAKGVANIVELPKDATRLREIVWSGARPSRIGAIQWDGKYLAAEISSSTSSPTTLARLNVGVPQAAVVDRIALSVTGIPLQFWIDGTQIIVPVQRSSRSAAGVTSYRYPAAAQPLWTVRDTGRPQAITVSRAGPSKIAVTTYHYDTLRTGWDDEESLLTYSNVNSGSFGLLQTVTLDDQVDAQPLIIPNETTTTGVDPGKHDVVYVTTESNTVYAIDASSGTLLFQRSLGNPVPMPLGCNNNGPNVGINGTPVIDRQANVMYVIAYTLQANTTPAYFIHELNLSDLKDVVPQVPVTASHELTNGTQYTFNATYQRQRPGLLEANGNIYAGFGSFCDFAGSLSRGWLLGWQAGSLTPLAANRLNDTLASSQDDFFLSSIWMAGSGIAADTQGNVYFVTGNSDYSGNSYNSVTNISETVAKVSPDLTQLLTFFTPSDVGKLDQEDGDFGSGGVLLLPKAGASAPALATAAGKQGTLYLLDRNKMGGYHSGENAVLDRENIGGCWCAESYFDAATDSTPRIVASGGNTMTVWKVPTSRPVKLTLDGVSPNLPGGQDPGFFTAVSSNGSSPGAIIWAIARPQYVPGPITLFAFEAEPPNSSSTLQTLFQAPAGNWESTGGDADIVPVVANGKVYVASYRVLDIFGLLGSKAKAVAAAPVMEAPPANIGAPHQITGTLVAIHGSQFTLRARTGKLVVVDDSEAMRRERSALLFVGEAFSARGAYDAAGVLHAVTIVREKPSQGTWPPDK